uniref:IRF tryptophan pentad repeat domain-containing protein n=1 Tax=Astatotilapia calliptera TaxID=8154 RepID=A0A3P8NWZ8_ASTCA
MAHSKPLLIPWLQEQINSNKYPGVQWTNPEQTKFCIPWKHALRQDSSNTDILIFKAWAEVSGSGRANGDPSVWKRNFRSALRAKGFKMVDDNKNDAANPHKVFQWPDESTSKGEDPCVSVLSQTQDIQCLEGCLLLPEGAVFLAESAASPDILQECLRGMNISPEAEGTAGFEPPPEQQQLQNQVAIGGHPLPGQQQYPVMYEGAVTEAGLPEQPAHPIGGAEGGAYDEQLAAQFLQTMQKTSDGDNFRTQFKISVYYRGVKVLEQMVENEAGVRLVYSTDLNGTVLDRESGLTIVSLPSPGAMVDQNQASLTQRILDMLGDGLEVGVSGQVVYSQRRGESKAFWSFCKFDQSRQPQEISKHPQVLYKFTDFVRGIKDFIEGNAKECAPCSLFFCIGEKWPDPQCKPLEKKLIAVEVCLTSMELLKNMAVENGASSLKSVELQMSLEEMMEY